MAPDTPFREPEMKDTPPFQGPDTARGISQEIPLAFLKERWGDQPTGGELAPHQAGCFGHVRIDIHNA